MSDSVTRAFYLTSGAEATYALFDDLPARRENTGPPIGVSPSASDTTIPSPTIPRASVPAVGVLLCPLFGNDDLCAYRARRAWAKTLAVAMLAVTTPPKICASPVPTRLRIPSASFITRDTRTPVFVVSK